MKIVFFHTTSDIRDTQVQKKVIKIALLLSFSKELSIIFIKLWKMTFFFINLHLNINCAKNNKHEENVNPHC